MDQNFLLFNQDKTEVVIIGLEDQNEKILSNLQTVSFNPSRQVRSLEVLFDSDLTFIKQAVKTAFII